MMVEGIHFNRYTMRDEDVGYKALAVNVSDLAAMGAEPRYALVSVSAPPDSVPDRIERIYSGLYECADQYRISIIGGDMTSSPQHVVLSVTIVGTVEAGRAKLRSAAKAGDVIFVTGEPGLSSAGLHYMLQQDQLLDETALDPTMRKIIQAHRRPEPPVAIARKLCELSLGHSLNDLSDGTASEAWEIAEASGIGLVLYENELPIAPQLRDYGRMCGVDPLKWFLYGGEDYQLIGTASESDAERIAEICLDHGTAFHIIGRTDCDRQDVVLVPISGESVALPKGGYNHFRA